MPNEQEPVVLELAPLPREQLGPFLLLGVDKAADKEQIEASWARRVLGARKGLISLALEDINWAREVLSDLSRRARADGGAVGDRGDGERPGSGGKRVRDEPDRSAGGPRAHVRADVPGSTVPARDQRGVSESPDDVGPDGVELRGRTGGRTVMIRGAT